MALASDRMTEKRQGELFEIPLAANAIVYTGALVMVDAGYLKPGAPSTTAIVVGRANNSADNTGGSDGDKTVTVEKGCFKFKNSGTDPITQADLFNDCYIEDDETVSKTNNTNTRIKAGQIVRVESDGIFVDTRK